MPGFSEDVWKRLVEHIFVAKEFTPDMLSAPEVRSAIDETCRILTHGVDSAIKRQVPQELIDHLHNDTFLFSGFKTYHTAREISAMLLDPETGSFKNFDKFFNEVRSINERYNHAYLKAEYNFAVQSTQMAVKWHDFEQDGDRYLLQYRTANDGNVRPEHQALHNTTLPIGDPFWNDYTPPLGWNCRCTVVQVRRDKYPESDSATAIRAGEEATAKPKLQIFRFNPGKTLSVFPPKHPYYKVPEGVAPIITADTEQKRIDSMVSKMPSNLTDEEKQALAKHNIELEKQLGISKGERMTIDEADKQSANPNYGKRHFDDNCQTCSPAYMLRLQGFNVTAKACLPGSKSDYLSRGRSWEVWKNIDGTPAKHTSVNDWMASKGYKQMNPKRYKEFYEENCEEVGVYQTSIKWKGRGGHATILQRLEDGSLLYVEPQVDNSSDRSIDYLCNNGKTSGLTDNRGVMRIDNKLFNTDFIDIFNK